MSSNIVLFLIFISFITCQLSSFNIFNKDEIIDKNLYYQITRSKIEELLKKNEQLNNCAYINKYYKTNLSSNEINKRIDEAYSHLLSYSTRRQNDISTYYDCVRNDRQYNAYTFIVVQFDLKLKEIYYPNKITYGLCIVEDISLYDNNQAEFTKDIITMTKLLNQEADFMFFDSSTILNVINTNEYQKTPSQWYEIFFLSICVIFSIMMLFFIVINKVPECLFKNCFKKQGGSNNNKNNIGKSKNEVDKQMLREFVSCFSFTENNEELLSKESNTKLYNDTGLSYTKGVRSICFILFIFGLTYMRIFQSATLIFQEEKYKSALKSFSISIFTFGLRHCPRIIFSISGFTFIYKLLCFFDEENERISEVRLHSIDGINGDGNTSYIIDTSRNISNDSLQEIIDSHNKLKCSSMFIFYIKQLNKFISGIMMVIIFKTMSSIMKKLSLFCASRAILYKDILGKILFSDIFGHFFLYKNFLIFDGNLSGNKNEECCMRFIWVFMNEIFFFVFTTPLIFIWYKFKLSLNKILMTLFTLFLVIRYLIYYLVLQNTNIITTNNEYQRATNTINDYYAINSFIMNPIYNYPTFLIGVIFGLMNYVLQKGLNEDDVAKDTSVSFSITIVYYFKYQPKMLLYIEIIIEIVLIGLIIFIEPLFHLGNNNIGAFYSNNIINAFYLIDVEVVILLIHLILFSFYAKGGNLFTQMLSENTWIKFNKLYFSAILSANIYILVILHQSETRISLEVFSVVFYGIIIFISVLFFSYFNCVLSEFPLKKLIKLVIDKYMINKRKI